MIDAKQLLEQFLGAGQDNRGKVGQGAGGGPWERSAGQRTSGDGLGGGGLAGVGDALGSLQDYARRNPLLAGGLAGGLASILLGSKGGRKLSKNALTYGAVAAIGGLAYKAYRDYQARQGGQDQPSGPAPAASSGRLLPAPADSPFAIANAPQGADAFALDLIGAMIAAAKADGHIDDAERARITARFSDGGLAPEAEAFLSQELAKPLDIERIVRAAKNKEEAVELYAASYLSITPDHPAERGYLDMLAARLGLEPELARTIERTVAEATG